MANCVDCTRFEDKSCPWDYEYQNTDYAEDCTDYTEYSYCDTCGKANTCVIHLSNPNISGCRNY